MKIESECGMAESHAPDLQELQRCAAKLGLSQYQRHIFLCADAAEPKCAPREAGLQAWEFLKRRLKELGLSEPHPLVLRTKAGCLRVCRQGPIAVVYPEGVWYHSCTPIVLENIIQQHLISGVIVEAYAFTQRALDGVGRFATSDLQVSRPVSKTKGL